MILVTGAAGYIGSNTTRLLIDAGYKVVAVDNLYSGFRSSVPEGIPFYKSDIGEISTLDEIFTRHKIESIIHFAAHLEVEESVRLPMKYFRNNLNSTERLVEAALKYRIENLVFSSTCSVYGNVSKNPVVEDMPTYPINPYGQSKLASEWVIRGASSQFPQQFRSVILRYFNVGGARTDCTIGQSTKNATQLIKVASEVVVGRRSSMKIYGDDYDTVDGTCIRDYIHVVDIASAHVQAVKYLQRGGESEVFNCGYGKGSTVRQVVSTMEAVIGRKIPVEIAPRRPGDPAAIFAETTKIRKKLGWIPQYEDLGTICTTALAWEQHLFRLRCAADKPHSLTEAQLER